MAPAASAERFTGPAKAVDLMTVQAGPSADLGCLAVEVVAKQGFS